MEDGEAGGVLRRGAVSVDDDERRWDDASPVDVATLAAGEATSANMSKASVRVELKIIEDVVAPAGVDCGDERVMFMNLAQSLIAGAGSQLCSVA